MGVKVGLGVGFMSGLVLFHRLPYKVHYVKSAGSACDPYSEDTMLLTNS